MIGYLEGEVIYAEAGKIILEINGVGYELELAGFKKQLSVGEDIEVYTYTYVREDALKLFAFPERMGKDLFEILITVNGIGPSAGLNIINTMPASRFISAIMKKNEEVLKEISGIGPKTAQRLILELQGKLEDFAYLQNLNNRKEEVNNIDEDRQDVVDALTALGYKISEINRALREVEFKAQQNVSEKIRLVLSHLGKER
ncbi:MULTISPECIES: Holliday junction branch migration protein RuvA [Halanaerobium]|uniref:Holliday junction branch migration complex subunit RuvA n=1 Tax=Halanaerobium saccharolyticum TaxID=43595 RepID=A0A4R6S7E8_9FIRM|nr:MULTISPECIES: Holliday junction branch migration protein RuvA [Halanaerobium]PUU94711.1 MAG: Holliday junction ATP-dependent DNA helicase RuvA [Halanaerobium sp.]PUU94840.1 MAG: Holliday junction ATP-dependent DNA helicase RuvA [Halanaerobium sp.]TDP94746.1 Holliday junction DNA helicase subunit RuvA [Halanaerobium saccharolyticum]